MRGFISPLQFNIYNLTERGANNWNAIESRYLDFFVQWFIYLTNQIDWILWEIFNLRETLEQVLLFFLERQLVSIDVGKLLHIFQFQFNFFLDVSHFFLFYIFLGTVSAVFKQVSSAQKFVPQISKYADDA